MMINRQEAIEELRNIALYRYAEITGKWDKRATAIDMAIEVLSQPPADQWIPCSEQAYPTEEGWYWITGKYDGWEEPETRLFLYAANMNGEFEWMKEQFELQNVTAWMPANLPEPYKGVE